MCRDRTNHGKPRIHNPIDRIGGWRDTVHMKNIQNRSFDVLRLTPAPWFARLEEIASDAEVAAPTEAGALLMQLQALIALAPQHRGGIDDGAAVPGAEIAAMIAAGADTSAALAMLPRRSAWMLSSGADGGLFLATLVLPGMIDDVTAQGASPALALIAAMAMAVAGGSMLIDRDDDNGPCPRFA